jgi:hypothetical protein
MADESKEKAKTVSVSTSQSKPQAKSKLTGSKAKTVSSLLFSYFLSDYFTLSKLLADVNASGFTNLVYYKSVRNPNTSLLKTCIKGLSFCIKVLNLSNKGIDCLRKRQYSLDFGLLNKLCTLSIFFSQSGITL